jgi:hypothetical protein
VTNLFSCGSSDRKCDEHNCSDSGVQQKENGVYSINVDLVRSSGSGTGSTQPREYN